MKYVALLRGINVGGKNKVEMTPLKIVFEALGASNVVTYINSGNVIFDSDETPKKLVKAIEKKIEQAFGFHVHVVLKSKPQIEKINQTLPASWTNSGDQKTDVMFLWEEVDHQDTLKRLTIKPDIDRVKYVTGAILWNVDRDKVTKSGLLKIVGTDFYKKMTIRNANTLRKIHELMSQVA